MLMNLTQHFLNLTHAGFCENIYIQNDHTFLILLLALIIIGLFSYLIFLLNFYELRRKNHVAKNKNAAM